MQKVNWGNFRAKFDEKEQKSFEWLSYLLFCDEFHKSTGIFRYKNQPGIETEPILVKDVLVGFQAKFYDTKISENVKDIKESIQVAKADNPELQRILFYLNQEFSRGREPGRKEPKYQINIEKFATEQDIQIEWRVPSHFEAQLSLERNRNLVQHFFSLDKSIVDLIEELRQSTEWLFVPIHSKIEFNSRELKIDRSSCVEELKTTSDQFPLVILSGKSGVGKTAVIKDFYDAVKEEKPFFAFKVTAFNISHINQLFQNSGTFTFADFLNEHKEAKEKYIVIDSAERLFDLDNQEVFQGFLSALVKDQWHIIFTIRDNFLENLKVHFLDVYRLPFRLHIIERLTSKEIEELSKTHQFPLPQNKRLLELITSPFYLSEYLQYYQEFPVAANLSYFKSTLWRKVIQGSHFQKNTHIKREVCFLKIVKERITEGKFFVEAEGCDNEILPQLEADEIIKRNPDTGWYFITHDIYEEWALEKIIERAFRENEEYKQFFTSIGTSLPMRRAFRAWLSEKLFNATNEVKGLIEDAIPDDEVEKYWKDEVQVSVLLSEYSEAFFQLFEAKLLEDNQSFLVRLIFLLRIACTQLDENLLQLFGIDDVQPNIIIAPFTKPKGRGWSYTIDFIHTHLAEIDLQNISFILPLLEDWVTKKKDGKTTKEASQIALFYYEKIITDEEFSHIARGKTIEQIFKVILQGASEIKDEMNVIFEEVIREKQTKHQDKHYALVKTILTSPTGSFEVARTFSGQVLRLADLFWSQTEQTNLPPYASRGPGVEEDFGISADHFEYYPSSAFQTPTLFLLRNFPMETMNFILLFTDKTTEAYANSDLDGQIDEVDVFLGENKVIKQYISNRLWNIYRGTQVAPCLLESIHMALEKWLLDYAKVVPQKHLESVCRYLMSKSRSASITAVITSVVIANPEKLFNIAAVLFQTKQFFLYDTNRWMLDQHERSSYAIGYGSDFKSKMYLDERMKTCDDPHRKFSLEHLAFRYQIERSAEESDEEAERKQRVLSSIFDNYYQDLPDKENETEYDKTWQLYLTRMDARKMKAQVEENDGQVQVTFHPEIEPELKKYSEASVQKSSEAMKYLPLQLWAKSRFKQEEDYKRYVQYENDPQLVIAETKDILKKLQSGAEEDFPLFYASIPAYTCSALLRDYIHKLSVEERRLCKDILIEFASLPLESEGYQYQITDGIEPAIASLPGLLKRFPEDHEIILLSLFLLLLHSWKEIANFAIKGVSEILWEISFQDAHSLLLGYLLLKQSYDKVREEKRMENYQNGIYGISEKQVIEIFEEQYEKSLDRIVTHEIAYDDLTNLEQLNGEVLVTAFELLPLRIENEDHKKFLTVLFSVFSKRLFKPYEKAEEHALKRRFLKKLVRFLLSSSKKHIQSYLQLFIENMKSSEGLEDLLFELISAEDKLNQYEIFWFIWDACYEKIVEIAKSAYTYSYTKSILHNYLLAWPYWREGITEWHSLKGREKFFYSRVANDIGHCPAVLYSLAKVLNDIGSNDIEEGITWISTILEKNENLLSGELETNTIYYIESLVRRYISKNQLTLKTTLRVKKQVMIILNFLVEKGSTTGYWLRDDIL